MNYTTCYKSDKIMNAERKIYEYPKPRKFVIIPFKAIDEDQGRCTNCDANKICGIKFTCPCTIDEQLQEIE